MPQHATFDEICERLRALIDGGRLPDKAAQQAGRLLQRLETPVRFALLGPSGAERARILNGLLGRQIVPLGPTRPSVELVFAETPSTRATLPSGRIVTIEDPQAGFDPATVFLSLARNEPLLRTTRLLDVVTDGSAAELRMALRWAAKRADVFLWCSDRFEEAELEVWRSVEERFTDHAFLVLWGADRDARAPDLKRRLAGDFLDVIAVDLEAGDAGRDPGLRRLSDGLKRHVDLGRQADNDSALLFLKKFASLAAGDTAGPLAPSSIPVSLAAVAPPPQAPAATPPQMAARSEALEAACRQCLSLLGDRARQLAAFLDTSSPQGADGIASHCRQTIEYLTEILDSANDLPDSDRTALSDLLMNAEELLVLMEIEGDGQPDVDSLCLLIQLRREFEARLAA